MMKSYKIIGLMSGTSLDGLDLAFCHFWEDLNKWFFKIEVAETVAYSELWRALLREAHLSDGYNLSKLHSDYGNFLGECVNNFILKHNLQPDSIASHGHTVFHQPQFGFTLQIGSGANIAAKTRIPVICDFRTADVALGGQGAPLVPFGDRHLFGDFAACLNIGGFANISFENDNSRIAFDICPSNITLNHFAQKLGFDFDKDGAIAKSGSLNQNLFDELNKLPFYHAKSPKSLGREWLEAIFLPAIESYGLAIADSLRTITEHIAFQISQVITSGSVGEVLVTGGGAENNFLIEKIKSYATQQIIIPEIEIVRYKEAMIFAFLGLMRLLNRPNVLSSATGAKADSCSGAVYRV